MNNLLMKPRIGIDCHVLDGIYQGSRTYLINLISNVVSIAREFNFIILLNEGNNICNLLALNSLPNVKIVYISKTDSFRRLFWIIPRIQKKYKIDLLHMQYTIPFNNYSKYIVTIHDILFESHPQYFKPLPRLGSKILVRYAAKKATKIVTVSNYSKEELIKIYQLSPSKIAVIYNGVNLERYFPGREGEEFLSKRNLRSKGYILSVGRLEPRKNYASLIKAYSRLDLKLYPLIIVGQKDFEYQKIFSLVKELKLKENVFFYQDVNDIELPILMRHARLFVYPSFAEGFGIPPLEAMASGLPLISSDRTALPEVIRNAGVFIDPQDINNIANAIKDTISDTTFCDTISKRGLKIAKTFSWENSAKRLHGVYREIFFGDTATPEKPELG